MGLLSVFVRTGVLAATALALVDLSSARPTSPDALTIGDGERLLVVAPHPDDETLGAGGLIQRVLSRRGSVHVVLVTAGDGNVGGVVLETGLREPPAANYIAYGERRIAETRAAVCTLGVPAAGLELLGFPDGDLMPMLTRNWRRAQPARSATTGASDPPYAFVLDPKVAYDGTDLRDELVRVLEDTHPTLIAVPDPIDRHPDHDATGVFTILAIDEWMGRRWPHQVPPRVLTYLVHWPDWPPGWDAASPDPASADRPLVLPATLPPRPLDAVALELTDAEVDRKRTALGEHASQQRAMGTFLAAFMRRSEPFTLLDVADIRAIASEYEREPTHQAKRPGASRAG